MARKDAPPLVHRFARWPFVTIAWGRLAVTLPSYLVGGAPVVYLNTRRIVAERGGLVPRELRAHEYGHVLQYWRLGTWRFYWRYLVEWARHGYGPGMPMEREAMEYAARFSADVRFAPFVVEIRR